MRGWRVSKGAFSMTFASRPSGTSRSGLARPGIGARFAATQEALGTLEAKNAFLRAAGTDTVRTYVLDIMQQLGWPDEYSGRALMNRFAKRWHGREAELESRVDEARASFEAAREYGGYDEMYVYAGQAVGLIRDLPPAAELVERLVDGLRAETPG